MSAHDVAAPHCHHEPECITCSDEGVPMRVVDVRAESGLATCLDADGARGEVMTGLLDQVAVGDTLLVHAGTALLRLDPHAEERDHEIRR